MSTVGPARMISASAGKAAWPRWTLNRAALPVHRAVAKGANPQRVMLSPAFQILREFR